MAEATRAAPAIVELQWGRAPEGAEISTSASKLHKITQVLQWGRTPEGAEMFDELHLMPGRQSFNGAAPWSGGRGDILSTCPGKPPLLLQWGRATEGAEIDESEMLVDCEQALQWGRTPEGAEIRGGSRRGHRR